MLRRAPFTYNAWRSPEVLSRISEVAGMELVPVMDTEIAAINIAINNQNPSVAQINDSSKENDLPAFAWHYDSYPFVCVTMLSDCTHMTGGETALKTGTGEIMKVRGPAMVNASLSLINIDTLLTRFREPPSLCKADISITKHSKLLVDKNVSA